MLDFSIKRTFRKNMLHVQHAQNDPASKSTTLGPFFDALYHVKPHTSSSRRTQCTEKVNCLRNILSLRVMSCAHIIRTWHSKHERRCRRLLSLSACGDGILYRAMLHSLSLALSYISAILGFAARSNRADAAPLAHGAFVDVTDLVLTLPLFASSSSSFSPSPLCACPAHVLGDPLGSLVQCAASVCLNRCPKRCAILGGVLPRCCCRKGRARMQRRHCAQEHTHPSVRERSDY